MEKLRAPGKLMHKLAGWPTKVLQELVEGEIGRGGGGGGWAELPGPVNRGRSQPSSEAWV